MKKIAHYQYLEYQRIYTLMREWRTGHGAPLKVLDYGCGHGKFLDMFTKLDCLPTGVDANPKYVDDARARGYVCLSAEEFNHDAPSNYDIVFLSHLVEHLHPEALKPLISTLYSKLVPNGKLIIVTPVPGERFYHDFSHIRPYLPQSIRHAFGQSEGPLLYGKKNILTLTDIYFFKDPWRTRLWRSFYFGDGLKCRVTQYLNRLFDALWWISNGTLGTTASWMGIYQANATSTHTSSPVEEESCESTKTTF